MESRGGSLIARLLQLNLRGTPIEYGRVLTPAVLDSYLSRTPPRGFDHSLHE